MNQRALVPHVGAGGNQVEVLLSKYTGAVDSTSLGDALRGFGEDSAMLGLVSFKLIGASRGCETHSVSRASRKVARSCSSVVEVIFAKEGEQERERARERKSREETDSLLLSAQSLRAATACLVIGWM